MIKKKKKSNYVLPTKDLFQIYGHLTQNEELKNTFPTSRNEKKVISVLSSVPDYCNKANGDHRSPLINVKIMKKYEAL